MYALDHLDVPRRQGKPRSAGITLVRDSGLTNSHVAELCALYGQYLDYVKIRQFVIWYLDREQVQERVALYLQNDVIPFPGGTVFEAAYLRDEVERTLRELQELGFTALELSDNVIDLTIEEKLQITERAAQMGFDTMFEYGKKYEDDPLDPVDAAVEINQLLGVGASRVILERSQLDATIGNDGASADAGRIVDLVGRVGLERLIFEAETMAHQTWLISTFGQDVNLGPNIEPYHVVSKLEPSRVGIGRDEGYSFFAQLGADGARPRSAS